jgi:hypothetical protein
MQEKEGWHQQDGQTELPVIPTTQKKEQKTTFQLEWLRKYAGSSKKVGRSQGSVEILEGTAGEWGILPNNASLPDLLRAKTDFSLQERVSWRLPTVFTAAADACSLH